MASDDDRSFESYMLCESSAELTIRIERDQMTSRLSGIGFSFVERPASVLDQLDGVDYQENIDVWESVL